MANPFGQKAEWEAKLHPAMTDNERIIGSGTTTRAPLTDNERIIGSGTTTRAPMQFPGEGKAVYTKRAMDWCCRPLENGYKAARAARIVGGRNLPVAELFSMRGTGFPVVIWPYRGRIWLEDFRESEDAAATPNIYEISLAEAIRRLESVNDMKNEITRTHPLEPGLKKMQRFIEQMILVCKEARSSGTTLQVWEDQRAAARDRLSGEAAPKLRV